MDNISPCHGEETSLSLVQSAKIMECGLTAWHLPVKKTSKWVRLPPFQPRYRFKVLMITRAAWTREIVSLTLTGPTKICFYRILVCVHSIEAREVSVQLRVGTPNMHLWPSGLGGNLQNYIDQFKSDWMLQNMSSMPKYYRGRENVRME